jgi:hypothetical protein
MLTKWSTARGAAVSQNGHHIDQPNVISYIFPSFSSIAGKTTIQPVILHEGKYKRIPTASPAKARFHCVHLYDLLPIARVGSSRTTLFQDENASR